MDSIFSDFSNFLNDRFRKKVYTTEDSVRYAFFYSIMQSGKFSLNDIILEYPHDSIERAKIDMYIPQKDSSPGFVFEFKFDRVIPSEKNSPRTQKAGKIFADLFRLALFGNNPQLNRYFVYVTDDEMASYLLNPSNKLTDFFTLSPEKSLLIDANYLHNHSGTFISSTGKNIKECSIQSVYSANYEEKMYLRVYSVSNTIS